MHIDHIENELRFKLEDYKSKHEMIEEVIPNDTAELLAIVQDNESEFSFEINGIRQRLAILLQTRIGLR
jgi:hypothetical protein